MRVRTQAEARSACSSLCRWAIVLQSGHSGRSGGRGRARWSGRAGPHRNGAVRRSRWVVGGRRVCSAPRRCRGVRGSRGSGRCSAAGMAHGRDPVCEDGEWASCRVPGGDGLIDVLVNRSPMFPIDLMWDEPRLADSWNRRPPFAVTSGSTWRVPARRTRSPTPRVASPKWSMRWLQCSTRWDANASAARVGPRPVLFAAAHP